MLFVYVLKFKQTHHAICGGEMYTTPTTSETATAKNVHLKYSFALTFPLPSHFSVHRSTFEEIKVDDFSFGPMVFATTTQKSTELYIKINNQMKNDGKRYFLHTQKRMYSESTNSTSIIQIALTYSFFMKERFREHSKRYDI